jgi:glycosyltransferase involved in cell wall biosynthesis
MKGKKVLFVCPYPLNVAPSQRLKFEQYYPYFEEAGFGVEVSSFINKAFWKIIYKRGNFFSKVFYTILGYARRIVDLSKLPQYDIVYIHLWVTPFGAPVFEWLFKKWAKKIVYDIDDLVYLGNIKSQANPVITWIKGRNKPLFLMKHADHVITCTPYLDEFVRKYNPNTTDISSTVDTFLYHPKMNYSEKDEFIIGWSGSHSTSKYLHLLDEVFRQLSKAYSYKLLVMGDPKFTMEGVKVEAMAWKEKYEIEVISRFDIGVYPLPDEEWVMGKSGLKAIQYMALGIPTVATAIGANFRVIDDGISGFLVKTEKEWIEILSRLIKDAGLRMSVGKAARQKVEACFSLNANAHKYLNILQKLCFFILYSWYCI